MQFGLERVASDPSQIRRTKLLAAEDPHNRGQLDTHPLVREYFGEQLRSQTMVAWKECNKRLFNYYKTLAPPLPDNFAEMEPLFSAVIYGCNAGLFREALHEVYTPRIQRGNTFFAANVLGARGVLLSILTHFFIHGRWDSPVETGSRSKFSRLKTSSSSSCRQGYISQLLEDFNHPRRECVITGRNLSVMR